MSDLSILIQKATELLQNAQKIAILTGAGISKESGIPTFRDAMDGLWSQYDPMQLATPEAFQRDPKLVWDWYEYRRRLVRQAKPNPGHLAVAELGQRHDDMTIITQNVDHLHEQAGSQDVVHLHGNIMQNKCFNDCQGNPTIIELSEIETDKDNPPPTCPYCGAYIRPNVIWFGEVLPEQAISTAWNASQSADVMLVIGTSGLVTPAALLPEVVYQSGGKVIEVNPVQTPISHVATIQLKGASGEILPQLVAEIH